MTVQVSSGVPQSVQVKYAVLFFCLVGSLIDLFLSRYLSSTSVSDRDNITWAGLVNTKTNKSFQSLSGDFSVDGRFIVST